MPLCKLEIPSSGQLSPQIEDQEAAVAECNRVLNLVIDRFDIPDPGDKEVCLVKVDAEHPQLVLSFSVGPNEYPRHEPSSLDPDRELVREVVAEIHREVSEALGITQTRMEAYRDSTFVITPTELPQDEPVSDETKKEILSKVTEPKLTIFLSPNLRQGASVTKEIERDGEDPFEEVAIEVSLSIGETLGLPNVETEVVWTEYADSEVSMELDCQVEGNYRIPSEAREAAAKSAERALNQNIHTRDREAEIWIRQGDPEVETFPL